VWHAIYEENCFKPEPWPGMSANQISQYSTNKRSSFFEERDQNYCKMEEVVFTLIYLNYLLLTLLITLINTGDNGCLVIYVVSV